MPFFDPPIEWSDDYCLFCFCYLIGLSASPPLCLYLSRAISILRLLRRWPFDLCTVSGLLLFCFVLRLLICLSSSLSVCNRLGPYLFWGYYVVDLETSTLWSLTADYCFCLFVFVVFTRRSVCVRPSPYLLWGDTYVADLVTSILWLPFLAHLTGCRELLLLCMCFSKA